MANVIELRDALRKRLRAMLTGFALAERGNVATTFALAIVPVIGFVGAAVDYSRANNARTALQSAVDATALMLSKDAIGLNAAQVQAKAQTYFSALYTNADGANVTISAAFSES